MRPIRLVMSAFGPYAGEQAVDFRQLGGRSFFLIHGPTGGGKTSLLDAMCYALYGDTSGHERTAEQMRCHLADPATPTSVTFDFALGEKRYRITRSPQQERPKRRGEGTMTDAPKAAIWDRTACADDSEEGVPIANQPTKVTKYVEELLGFHSEQFRQVMVLPQGKFRELLVASSQQREDILRVLFGTEIYGRMQEALKQRAKAIQGEVDQVRIEQETILRSAGAQNIAELQGRRDTTEQILNALKTTETQLRAAKTEASAKLSESQQVQAKLIEHQQARDAVARLESERPRIDQDRTRSAAAHRAARLAPLEAHLSERRRDAMERTKARSIATKALEEATRAHDLAFKQLNLQVARQSEAEACRQELAQLESFAERVAALDKAGRELREAETRAAALAAQLATTATESTRHKGVLEQTQSLLVAAKQMAATHEGNRLAVARCQQLLRARRELDQVRAEHAELEKNRAALLKRGEKASLSAAAAKAELERLQKLLWTGQAAVLASRLAAGEPCPVCGSPHHPRPATAEGEIPSAHDMERQQAVVAEGERKLIELRDEFRSIEVKLGKALATESAQLELLGDAREQTLEQLQASARQRQAAERASQAASEQVPVLESQIRAAEESLRKLTEQLAPLEAESKFAAENVTRLRAVRDGSIVGVPESLRTPAALAAARRDAAARLKAIEDALAQARGAASEAERALATATERMKAAGAEADAAAEAFCMVQAEFERLRADAGFASDAELQAAKLPETQVRELEERIDRFDQSVVAATARAERAAVAAKDLFAPDLVALQAAADEAERKLESALKQQTEREADLRLLDQTLAALRKAGRSLEELESQFKVIGHVSEIASGKNPAGLTFQRFVLTFLLDDVLVAASHRLRLMSKGRYQLQRRRERVDGRVSAGLDLEVFDTYTGTARAVATLSGGESFLASLSLALGLADVVQAHAGGIRLETLFIDEGFGSLDPEALDLAIRALHDLMKDGRLVGIISHVPELREQVSARLEITNDRQGSAARFVLA
ncbi:MAG TPA: SMC family ATPase [Tepidisphaeraceae bacterium]|jgi:exonuclease SbcC